MKKGRRSAKDHEGELRALRYAVLHSRDQLIWDELMQLLERIKKLESKIRRGTSDEDDSFGSDDE